MLCLACHHTNDDRAKFCDRCGQPIETRCPACASPIRPGARFCSECGQNLTPPPDLSQTPGGPAASSGRPLSLDEKLDHLQRYLPAHLADTLLANRGRLAGERKLVTVLFADLAGYTGLSAQVGEKGLFALMDELTGDGLVAFFGAPLAVEPAPQRAVRAALALLEHGAGARVLLVCTYRPEFVCTWSRKSYHRVITLTPPPPVVACSLDDLSQREVEVLRLLATGKSNRDIADVLYISLNTVATHVRNILTKTGTANRTEAAATGRKSFGSLTPVWTYLGLHGMDTSDSQAPKIVHAFMPRDTRGYTIKETWDVLGMRATRKLAGRV